MPGGSGEEVAVDLWAMAADLERQFAGYKQRLAERDGTAAARDYGDAAAAAAYDDDDDTGGGGGGCVSEAEEAEAGGRSSSGDVRGRMYEAYVRRRDERLREGWRARMERKEAEVKALWAQLELTGRAAPGGGDGDGQRRGRRRRGRWMLSTGLRKGDSWNSDLDRWRKTERNDDDKRRSSDPALAPRRITGKKHARTRSFSSSTTTSTSRSDVAMRRALSQEPPPSEPHAASAEFRKHSRARPAAGGAATTTATARPKTSFRRKNSMKGHGSARPAGPKLPRSLPRRASSGDIDALSRDADAAAPVQSSSSEYTVHGETSEASPPTPFAVNGDGSDVACAANARFASPESDRGEVVEAVPDGEPEAKNADADERREEEAIDASPDKIGDLNGEITSDSDVEPSYVYINKDSAEKKATAISEASKLAGSDAWLALDTRKNEENGEEVPPPAAAAAAAEIAATNAEEAPARESSDESSFSARSGLSARPSCSSRDQSIERLLEADAVLLRKKREQRRAEKSSTPKTPGSAGSRDSGGAARSPRDAVRGFKRFLSFGKKNRSREVTVIDCTSPSVPSPADNDGGSGRWHSAGSIKPRMGSLDAASDDTEHASPRAACSLQSLVAASPAKSELAEIVPQEKSPKAHRSFFSFRSLNCGRG